MNFLVTAGNTLVPLDQIRCITNIFTGRTGTGIALEACRRGHAVTLVTSHPDLAAHMHREAAAPTIAWSVQDYRTFDDLEGLMERLLTDGRFDVVVHCAAVSDYLAAGIYAPALNTRFRAEDGRWESDSPSPPTLRDRAAGKVKSDEPELWLRLLRAPKLVDRIRTDWGFHGVLVKFKLEVDVTDERLLEIAEQSRRQSSADLMVANTLEGADSWACLGPLEGQYQRLGRPELAAHLLDAVEGLHKERVHG